MPRKGTIESIAAVKTILISCVNRRENLYHAFINFTFYQVDSTELLNMLRDCAVKKCLRVLSNLYTDKTAVMRRDPLDQPVSIKRGFRQGCVLSPISLNIYTNHVMNKMSIELIFKIGEAFVYRFIYANDTVLITSSQDLQKQEIQLSQLGKTMTLTSIQRKLNRWKISFLGPMRNL